MYASPAARRSPVQRALAALLSPASEGGWAAAGPLVLRVAVGAMVAMMHGLHKVQEGAAHLAAGADWPLRHDVVALGLPAATVWAVLAALSQFVGGALLALGLATRPAALAVAATMAVAVWLNVSTGGPDAELALLYGLVGIAFATVGGGRYSLDHLAARRMALRAPDA